MKFVGTLIIVAAIAGVSWYYISPVFKTQVDTRWSDLTEFTAEDAMKNPELYLSWAKDETSKIEKELRAERIHLTSTKTKLIDERDLMRDNAVGYDRAGRELYALVQEDSWPAQWEGLHFDSKDEVKRDLVNTYEQVKYAERTADHCDVIIRDANNRLSDVRDYLEHTNRISREIKMAKRTAALEGTSDGIRDRLRTIEHTVAEIAGHRDGRISEIDDVVEQRRREHVDSEAMRAVEERWGDN